MTYARTHEIDNTTLDVAQFAVGAERDRLWQRVAAAQHVALFLDFDGTLAPFHADRMQAFPLPGTREAIERIAADPHTTVALVSGRPIHEILTLLGDPPVTMVGAHGYELRRADGSFAVVEISAEQTAVLDAAYREALESFIPERVERKAASVAAHFRGLDPRQVADVEAQLERSWRAMGLAETVEFRPFNGGLELRAAGRHKGTAIAELLETMPEGTLPVYIGDDDTDEDAFRHIAGRGIGIKVGPLNAVTAADARLPDIAAVLQLLLDWPMSTNGPA